MRSSAAVSLCLLLALRIGVSASQELDNAAVGRADALLRAGKAEEAWQLLAPLEMQHAGQADFDYVLGIAALESGRPNLATFILERIVAVNPGHVAARLEMARAYFALHDFERAEREFNLVLKSAPPPDIRSRVEAYLAAIREAPVPAISGLSGYAELVLGRDSNVPVASAQNSVFIPGLGAEFVPNPAFQRRPDDFFALGAGAEYALPLRPNLGLTAGADLRQRWHSDLEAFDFRAADLHLGLIHALDERDSMQYTLRHSEYELDNSRYRDTQSLAAQWSRGFSRRARIAVQAQGYRIRYLEEQVRASSSDLVIFGAGGTYVLREATRTVTGGSLYFGHDHAVAGRTDGDRRVYGFNLGLEQRLSPRVDGYVRYSLLESNYQTQNPDFGVTRRDRQHDAAAGLSWQLSDNWFLRPQVARTKNRSNLPLSDYSRTETSITLRRVWD